MAEWEQEHGVLDEPAPSGGRVKPSKPSRRTSLGRPFAPVGVSIVLDAGALIAIEHKDRVVWRALKVAALATEDVIVPSTVVAQVWRASAVAKVFGALGVRGPELVRC